jgi:hypothetical protein
VLLAITWASLEPATASDSAHSAALEQYRKLRCEPRSLSVQSTEPLRFAALATCYKLPKSFVHDGWIQLVAVDTKAGTVRLVDLGRDYDAARSLQGDGQGGWRWLARPLPHDAQTRELLAWTLAASETQPRLVGRVELPFAIDDHTRATPGDRCTLIGGNPLNHALVRFGDSGIDVQPVAGLRGSRLWHPGHRAFVVQTDPSSLEVHALLDCDGKTRALPDADAQRFAEFSRGDIAISNRGDWLVRMDSGNGDLLVIAQGEHRRSFGPFEWMPNDCPDVCDGVGLPLSNPSWSPDGAMFMAHGFFESMVVDAENLKTVFTWKYRDNSVDDHTALLSDSLAMELSKKRGVIFRRW